jgi:hypothetical protein
MDWRPPSGMNVRHSELVEESQSIILGEKSEIFRQSLP